MTLWYLLKCYKNALKEGCCRVRQARLDLIGDPRGYRSASSGNWMCGICHDVLLHKHPVPIAKNENLVNNRVQQNQRVDSERFESRQREPAGLKIREKLLNHGGAVPAHVHEVTREFILWVVIDETGENILGWDDIVLASALASELLQLVVETAGIHNAIVKDGVVALNAHDENPKIVVIFPFARLPHQLSPVVDAVHGVKVALQSCQRRRTGKVPNTLEQGRGVGVNVDVEHDEADLVACAGELACHVLHIGLY